MVPRAFLQTTLCALFVVPLVAVVAPAGAAPPPQPLCDACGESFEERVEDRGVAVDGEFVIYPIEVDRSTAEVRVGKNGTATWTVRNHLDDSEGTEQLRSNASYRTRIADGAMGDAELLDATVSQPNVLTLRYRESGFAEQSVRGTLRSGEFTSTYGYRNLHGLGADRLVVVAPDGHRIGRTVSDATVSDDGSRMTLTDLDEQGIVTFVPRDAALGGLWSLLAVGSLAGPSIAVNAVGFLVPSVALFAVIVAVSPSVFAALGRRWGDASEHRRRWDVGLVRRVRNAPGDSLAAVGGLTVVALVGLEMVGPVGPSLLPMLGVGITYVALGVAVSRGIVRKWTSYRSAVVIGALGGLVAAASTVAAAAVTGRLTPWLLSNLLVLVPIFALLPAGYAAGRGRRRLAVATATAGIVLGLLPAVPVTGSAVPILLALNATAVGLSAAVVGAPLLVLGAVLGSGRRDGEQEIVEDQVAES
ncbi:hypothetical protein SAMN06269185_2216 [Natronoarchaeum philippinense]|uniref:Uncharacterized protein n=1 Tax=Natronoarchaeum philippinense TaxID=558529 RepID=A0A285NVI6_NATPI|nr:hypothetical protein [Natronoarchaeum philippinense]SNZ13480.1 hypothetical protein SAMN06269185_2216 [Natronoarchaeum philippinense]